MQGRMGSNYQHRLMSFDYLLFYRHLSLLKYIHKEAHQITLNDINNDLSEQEKMCWT